MRNNLTNTVVTERVLNSTAAGTTNVNTAWVDTEGFRVVRFVALMGALTATQQTQAKLQYCDDGAGAVNLGDVAGSHTAMMADGDSNKLLICEDFEPLQRYVRMVIMRGTANAAIDGVVCELYQAGQLPVAQDASVSQYTLVQSQPAGVA
jgi:hypothetical protein